MGGSRVWEEKIAFLYCILFVDFRVSEIFKSMHSHMDLGNGPKLSLGWPQSFGDNLEVGGCISSSFFIVSLIPAILPCHPHPA